jgi:hypothetical protein
MLTLEAWKSKALAEYMRLTGERRFDALVAFDRAGIAEAALQKIVAGPDGEYDHESGCPFESFACRIAYDALRNSTMGSVAARIAELEDALRRVVHDVNDYEKTNNLSPNPGRAECWDSVAHAKAVLATAHKN